MISLAVLAGCKDKTKPEDDPGHATTSELSIAAVPYPNAAQLEQLGPENNLDTQWFLPDPVYVVMGRPKRFLESEIGKGNEPIIAGMIEQFLQIPFAPPKIDRFIQVTALPVEVTVEVEQNGQKVPQRTGMTRRSTMLTFSEPVKIADIVNPVLGNPADTAESRKRKVGDIEYYDLTPENFALPQRLAIAMIDERTIIVVEGEAKDVDAVFDGKRPKSAALDRLKRADIESNDLFWITSMEGIDFDPRILETIIGTLIVQSGVPQGVAMEMTRHLRAMTISVDLTVEVGQPMLNVRFDAKDADGAKSIGETFEGLILMGQTTLAAMDEAGKAAFPIPADFAEAALNSFHVKTEDAKVEILLNRFENFEAVAAKSIHGRQTAIQDMQIRQQRGEQIAMLHRLFMMYYQKFQKFPTDIKSDDGTPLLSWRVALLPVMGLEELHKKFKLDEPWDGPTNKPLMDSMPLILRPFAPNVLPPKTLLHVFNSEGTPLADPELKPEAIKFPNGTLLLYESSPENAVEWTRPESVVFDPEKIEQAVGEKLFGVTFSGQIVPEIPVLPLTDERSKQQRPFFNALVRGLPMPEEKPEETSDASVETPKNEEP